MNICNLPPTDKDCPIAAPPVTTNAPVFIAPEFIVLSIETEDPVPVKNAFLAVRKPPRLYKAAVPVVASVVKLMASLAFPPAYATPVPFVESEKLIFVPGVKILAEKYQLHLNNQ